MAEARVHIVRDGWALGISHDLAGQALRWNLRTTEVETFPQFIGPPQDVNAHGWQVGSDQAGKALFVSDAGNLTLPSLADHNEPLGDSASTISDDGRIIAGQALDADGQIRAVAWHCG